MKLQFLAFVFLMAALVGCGDKDPSQSKANTAKEEVLVTVNGQEITETDLTVTTEKIFSRGVANLYSQEINEKALESMVMMMAIAQDSEAKATSEELQVIESKTKRYREELLTELYMRKFADVSPPTEKQIKEYYEANKVVFGEKQIKQFEIIRTKTKPKGEALQKQLAELGKLSAEAWSSQVAALKKEKDVYEVVVSSTDVPNLDRSIVRVLSGMKKGEVSKVVYLNDKPNVIKVVNETVKQASPLAEVKTRIRKTLAAKKLKRHIKDVSSEIIKNAEVKYEQANE